MECSPNPEAYGTDSESVEIISKGILRNQDLKTTQVLFGKVTQIEPSIGLIFYIEGRSRSFTLYQ